MGKIVNQRELSDILGVVPKTLWEWQKEGLPIVRAGETGEANSYDTEQVIRWMIDRELAKSGREDHKDRLARLQGDKIEMELAVSRGDLIPAADVEPAWISIITAVRQSLLQLGVRLAPTLEITPGADAKRALIDEEVYDVLSKLSRHDFSRDDDQTEPDRQVDIRSAEEGPSQPVG